MNNFSEYRLLNFSLEGINRDFGVRDSLRSLRANVENAQSNHNGEIISKPITLEEEMVKSFANIAAGFKTLKAERENRSMPEIRWDYSLILEEFVDMIDAYMPRVRTAGEIQTLSEWLGTINERSGEMRIYIDERSAREERESGQGR